MKELSAILGLKSESISSGRGIAAEAATARPVVAPTDGQTEPVRQFTFTILFFLTACATAAVPGIGPLPSAPAGPIQPALTPEQRALKFTLSEPQPQSLGPDLKLWATHYHTPIVRPAPETISAALPLIGRDGASISPMLTQRDWCEAALQGSVSVRQGGKATAYVYVDSSGPDQANCDEFLGNLSDGVKNATRRARFMAVNHALGCGVRNIPLMPFRTIAVDPAIIPLESVIFAPELRGITFRHEGQTLVHDGFLFAGDRGGAIHGRHIDVFMIDDGFAPFEAVFASTASRTFEAHIVDADDPAAIAVKANHSSQCEPI